MIDVETDHVVDAPPSAAAPTPQSAPVSAARRRKPPGAWRALLPTPIQAMGTVIAVLCVSNIGFWVALHRAGNGPPVSVVGVREMTSRYLSQVQTSSMSPQEVSVRTSLFLSLAQDEVRRFSAANPGRLVLARECVLGGDQNDLTPVISRAVDTRLESTSQALAAATGASSSPMSAFVSPSTAPLAAAPTPMPIERRVPLPAGLTQ